MLCILHPWMQPAVKGGSTEGETVARGGGVWAEGHADDLAGACETWLARTVALRVMTVDVSGAVCVLLWHCSILPSFQLFEFQEFTVTV